MLELAKQKLKTFNDKYGYEKYKLRNIYGNEYAIDAYSKHHGFLKTKKAYITEDNLNKEIDKVINHGNS